MPRIRDAQHCTVLSRLSANVSQFCLLVIARTLDLRFRQASQAAGAAAIARFLLGLIFRLGAAIVGLVVMELDELAVGGRAGWKGYVERLGKC